MHTIQCRIQHAVRKETWVHNTFINVYDMGEGCTVNNLSAVSDIYLLLAISHSPYQESQHHNTCHFSQVSTCNSSPWILHMKYDMIMALG